MDLRYSERLAVKPRLDYKTMEECGMSKRPRVETQTQTQPDTQTQTVPDFDVDFPDQSEMSYCNPVILVNIFILFMLTFTFTCYALKTYPILQYMTPTHYPL